MKMKKVLRTIALLVCMLTLVSGPAYAYAATFPVCTINQPNMMSYDYLDGHKIIQPNESFILSNYAGSLAGAFLVPANHYPAFGIGCDTLAPYRLTVYMISPAFAVVYQTVITTGSANIQLPLNSYDRTFFIEITPIGGQAVSLAGYTYMYY